MFTSFYKFFICSFKLLYCFYKFLGLVFLSCILFHDSDLDLSFKEYVNEQFGYNFFYIVKSKGSFNSINKLYTFDEYCFRISLSIFTFFLYLNFCNFVDFFMVAHCMDNVTASASASASASAFEQELDSYLKSDKYKESKNEINVLLSKYDEELHKNGLITGVEIVKQESMGRLLGFGSPYAGKIQVFRYTSDIYSSYLLSKGELNSLNAEQLAGISGQLHGYKVVSMEPLYMQRMRLIAVLDEQSKVVEKVVENIKDTNIDTNTDINIDNNTDTNTDTKNNPNNIISDKVSSGSVTLTQRMANLALKIPDYDNIVWWADFDSILETQEDDSTFESTGKRTLTYRQTTFREFDSLSSYNLGSIDSFDQGLVYQVVPTNSLEHLNEAPVYLADDTSSSFSYTPPKGPKEKELDNSCVINTLGNSLQFQVFDRTGTIMLERVNTVDMVQAHNGLKFLLDNHQVPIQADGVIEKLLSSSSKDFLEYMERKMFTDKELSKIPMMDTEKARYKEMFDFYKAYVQDGHDLRPVDRLDLIAQHEQLEFSIVVDFYCKSRQYSSYSYVKCEGNDLYAMYMKFLPERYYKTLCLPYNVDGGIFNQGRSVFYNNVNEMNYDSNHTRGESFPSWARDRSYNFSAYNYGVKNVGNYGLNPIYAPANYDKSNYNEIPHKMQRMGFLDWNDYNNYLIRQQNTTLLERMNSAKALGESSDKIE